MLTRVVAGGALTVIIFAPAGPKTRGSPAYIGNVVYSPEEKDTGKNLDFRELGPHSITKYDTAINLQITINYDTTVVKCTKKGNLFRTTRKIPNHSDHTSLLLGTKNML